ncbi:MAG: hypothetical protein ACLP7J_03215 [Streptosporangiaceae bacterium]
MPDGQPAALCPAQAACRDLLELLAGVTDGRPGQGRDHPVAAVLALEDLYRRCGASRPVAGPPSKATIWRVVTGADNAADS